MTAVRSLFVVLDGPEYHWARAIALKNRGLIWLLL